MSLLNESGWRLGAADLIESGPDEAFDRVTRLVARILGVPVALVSILDVDRQVFSGATGLAEPFATSRQTPRSHSFCQYVVASGEPLVVADARIDPLVQDNPAIEALGVVAYLGLPLKTPSGEVIGTLCAIDHQPRQWTAADRETVQDLLAILSSELALREEVRFRRRAEEQARLMSREMEHRVKNSLSTVQAVISLSVRDTQSPADIRSDLLERVASLAKTHSLLVESDGTGALFGDIVASELQHYGLGGRIRTNGPEVYLTANEAVTLGMAMHELATNATKYGALAPGSEGALAIAWTLEQEAGRPVLRLRWTEELPAGIAAQAGAAPPEGFGSELLDTLIVRQLRGAMRREWTARGLIFEATMPLSADSGEVPCQGIPGD
ncbi:sensor histidine kinase [Jiella sp. M17.18]|uniref:sensor histidine kinase n=1 Tax=Jiella sp. M17.18 TaxID=3234247 RepID=UPI0034DFAB76